MSVPAEKTLDEVLKNGFATTNGARITFPSSSIAWRQYMEFATKEMSDENVRFLNEVARLNDLKNQGVSVQADLQSLYNQYVPQGASNQVNLKMDSRNAVNKDDLESFNKAAEEIIQLVSRDSWKRFEKSDLYTVEVKQELEKLAHKQVIQVAAARKNPKKKKDFYQLTGQGTPKNATKAEKLMGATKEELATTSNSNVQRRRGSVIETLNRWGTLVKGAILSKPKMSPDAASTVVASVPIKKELSTKLQDAHVALEESRAHKQANSSKPVPVPLTPHMDSKVSTEKTASNAAKSQKPARSRSTTPLTVEMDSSELPETRQRGTQVLAKSEDTPTPPRRPKL